MSRLTKLIKAETTGRRFSSPGTISDLVKVADNYTRLAYGTEYTITALFGAKVILNEESQISKLPLAVEEVQHAVTEAVFGEFREPIKAVKLALWERKYDKAEMLLSKLEEQMFYDE